MDPRAFLTSLYDAAVGAVDPRRLVGEALGRRGEAIFVRSVNDPHHREFVFAPERVALLSLGKAAVPMAAAADRVLGKRIETALVIGPRGTSFEGLPESYRKIPSGHPHPDAASLDAGRAALTLAGRLRKGDLLIVLLSGGGSSLAAAPSGSLTLEEKSRTIALLMAASAPIRDVNLVRGALSDLKGGRLALAAGEADIVTLVLSDLGDDGWHLVASGPTLGVPPSRYEARQILQQYRLLPLVPPSVRDLLEMPANHEKVSPLGKRWSVLLADIRTALEGARLEALRLGAEARVSPELLAGEARAAARRLSVAGATAGRLMRHQNVRKRRSVTIFGGETTVTVKGPGHGGRNRELALATAYHLAGEPGATALVAGTDGVDNENDAAGAFVDGTTLDRADALGLDPSRALTDNDTGPFFATLGDAFTPGPTGTNVGDVAFVMTNGHEGEGDEPDVVDEIPLPISL